MPEYLTDNSQTLGYTKPGPLDDSARISILRIYNEDDPRSLIRLAPDQLREMMLTVPQELRNLDEFTMRRLYREKHSNRIPTPTLMQLRLSIWFEHERVQKEMLDRMELGHCLRGIMSYDSFMALGKYPMDIAWLCTPIAAYEVKIREALDLGLERMREILDLPVVTRKMVGRPGKRKEVIKVNTALMNVQMRATSYLDMRAKGAIEQKVNISGRTEHLSIAADAQDLRKYVEGRNVDEINKRLEFLEKREKMLESGEHPERPRLMDVSPEYREVHDPSNEIDITKEVQSQESYSDEANNEDIAITPPKATDE